MKCYRINCILCFPCNPTTENVFPLNEVAYGTVGNIAYSCAHDKTL